MEAKLTVKINMRHQMQKHFNRLIKDIYFKEMI